MSLEIETADDVVMGSENVVSRKSVDLTNRTRDFFTSFCTMAVKIFTLEVY